MSKNVTFRFQETELERYDGFAASVGINRTKLIRNALKQYMESYNKQPVQTSSAIEAAQTFVGINAEMKFIERHPLYLQIKNKGLKVHNDVNDVIAEISDMKSLFDFLNAKVFKQ